MQAPPWLLEGLELHALVQRAQAAGVDQHTVKAASDAEDAKKAFVALLMSRDVVRAELVEMQMRDLKKRAVCARVEKRDLYKAKAAVFAKEVLISLILAKEAPWGWSPVETDDLQILPGTRKQTATDTEKVAVTWTDAITTPPAKRKPTGNETDEAATFTGGMSTPPIADSTFDASTEASEHQIDFNKYGMYLSSSSHIGFSDDATSISSSPAARLRQLSSTMESICEGALRQFSNVSSEGGPGQFSNVSTEGAPRQYSSNMSGECAPAVPVQATEADAMSDSGSPAGGLEQISSQVLCENAPGPSVLPAEVVSPSPGAGASGPSARPLGSSRNSRVSCLSVPSPPSSAPPHGRSGARFSADVRMMLRIKNAKKRLLEDVGTYPEEMRQKMAAIAVAAASDVAKVRPLALKEYPQLPPHLRGASLRSMQRTWSVKGGDVLEPMLKVNSELGDSPVRLVDARFIIELDKRGGRLCRRQDLPEAAFIKLRALKSMPGGGLNGDCLRIAAISHPWLQSDHPDPKGSNLRKISRVLQSLIKHSGGTYAVFLDFLSLFQKRPNGGERTETESRLFNRALSDVMEWFSHPYILTLKLTELPRGYPDGFIFPPGTKPNTATYSNRGWCFCESSVSNMVKDSSRVLDLGKLSGATTDFKEIVQECTCTSGRPPPLAPADFSLELAGKVFTSRGADEEKVRNLYEAAFQTQLSRTEFLQCSSLGWGVEGAAQFARLLSSGLLPSLKLLWIRENEIGNAGCIALAEACAAGTLPNLVEVYLGNNNISDAGCSALAHACAQGALPNLTGISLKCNSIGDDGCSDFAEACKQGALSCLKDLQLAGNTIGDAGCAALAGACANGALPNLTCLNLEDNIIGHGEHLAPTRLNTAVPALCAAFQLGMRSLRELKMDGNNLDAQQMAHLRVRILDVLQDLRAQDERDSEARIRPEHLPYRSPGHYHVNLTL